ncbi:helix-turn-helix domain-containing protein [Elizabethkingia ursingii]|uniref:HTH araC/xylS-type domain-containing protein n=1 Tax=Elizabethkingia ursingii TaxID=1756150 RepID=A0ABX3NFD0_9FLAO|nr:AraC family transcriptional regulator [Elizabethkingia ursingii]OPB94516.1 hypothetical protein BB021_18105 [Elizabethkingia ursingii]
MLFFFSFLSTSLYYPQDIKKVYIRDSLKNKSFNHLEQAYFKALENNKIQARLYAGKMLNKAKYERNYNEVTKAYLLLYKVENQQSSSAHLDSMIINAKKIKSSDYLSTGYLHKGNNDYHNGDYSRALFNYLEAGKYVKNNSDMSRMLDFYIGLLKLEVKEYEEAIQLFLSYKEYIERKKIKDKHDYINCICALSYAYSKVNDLKSSDYYVDFGFLKNKEIKDETSDSFLHMVKGINAYKRREYNKALADLRVASKIIRNDFFSLQIYYLSEYYIGRIYYMCNDDRFINQFEKVDNIMLKTKCITGELKEIYPILIDYYKKPNDKKKQLYYIERLLVVDKILNKKNDYIIAEISKKYDTPKLSRKKNLSEVLDSENYTLTWLMATSTIVIGGILIFIKYKTKKLRNNKVPLFITDFECIENIEIPERISDDIINNDIIRDKKTPISEDNLKRINTRLNEFESKKHFLDKNINLYDLSKKFNTNRVYLSKSVNELKGLSFPQYLNKLRIQYIVKELKENKNLRKLTIAAIAEKGGYNNAEAFSKSFKKYVGTLPSCFIKDLENNNLS